VVSDVLDLSASINPLGLPDSVEQALRENVGLLAHYPEPFADGLARDIAGHAGVLAETVLCGNGSTELIYLLARALRPRRVLVAAPTFSEYERACALQAGCSCVRFALSPEEGFRVDPARYAAALAGCDIAFLCNPNNPTGGLLERDAVLAVADAAAAARCVLVVDEAFIDLADGQSVMGNVAGCAHLVVLRSLTKFYALAGLRIGYAVLPERLVETLRKYKEPWTVNSLAQAAARAVLGDREYRERSLALFREEKSFLEERFRELGITYFPSAANYYLLRIEDRPETIAALRRKGILVRDCSNFDGLDGSFIRVAVRSRSENERLLKELSACAA
jgi:threonine-phosphate decarboxylase